MKDKEIEHVEHVIDELYETFNRLPGHTARLLEELDVLVNRIRLHYGLREPEGE